MTEREFITRLRAIRLELELSVARIGQPRKEGRDRPTQRVRKRDRIASTAAGGDAVPAAVTCPPADDGADVNRLDLIRRRAEQLKAARRYRCSRCGVLGHNVRACPLALAGAVVAPELGELDDPAAPPQRAVLDDLVPEQELDFG